MDSSAEDINTVKDNSHQEVVEIRRELSNLADSLEYLTLEPHRSSERELLTPDLFAEVKEGTENPEQNEELIPEEGLDRDFNSQKCFKNITSIEGEAILAEEVGDEEREKISEVLIDGLDTKGHEENIIPENENSTSLYTTKEEEVITGSEMESKETHLFDENVGNVAELGVKDEPKLSKNIDVTTTLKTETYEDTEHQLETSSLKEDKHTIIEHEQPKELAASCNSSNQLEDEAELKQNDELQDSKVLIETVKLVYDELLEAKKKNKQLASAVLSCIESKHEFLTPLDVNRQQSEELLEQYRKRLNTYREMKEFVNKQTANINREMQSVVKELNQYREQYAAEVRELLKLEMDLGKNSVESDGSNLNPLTVENLVNKHAAVLEQLEQKRMMILKLKFSKEKVEEQLNEITVGNELGGVFLYEQLKRDNCNYKEKIEERDVKLKHLRNEAVKTIHKMAHVRNVTKKTQRLLDEKQNKLGTITDYNLNRKKQLVAQKKYRDRLRKSASILENKGAMLLYPNVLLDYKNTDESLSEAKMTLKDLKTKYNNHQATISKLQHKIMLRLNNVNE